MKFFTWFSIVVALSVGVPLFGAPKQQVQDAFRFPENAPSSGMNKLYGEQALAEKLYLNATKYFTLYLQEAKTSYERTEATALLAKAFLLDNHPDQALKIVNDFLTAHGVPKEAPLRNALYLTAGQANIRLGEYTTALNFLTPLIEMSKEELGDLRAQAFTAAADAWNATGRWDDTLQTLNAAIDDFSGNPQECANLTWRILQAAIAQRQWETARNTIATLKTMNISDAEQTSLKLLHISCDIGEGKTEEALQFYKANSLFNAVPQKADKQWWDALSALASACQAKGLQKDAADIFGATCLVATTEEDFIAASKNQAEALVAIQALPEAKDLLLALNKKFPNDVSVTLRLAEIRKELQERRSASELFLSLAKNDALEGSLRYRAAVEAAQCLGQEGLADDAEKIFRLAEKLTSSPQEQSNALRLAAEQNEKIGRLDDAVALFLEVADRFGEAVPNVQEARLEAGRILAKQGKAKEAIEQFQKFLDATAENHPLRWTARIAIGKATVDHEMAVEKLLAVARECPDAKTSSKAYLEAHTRALCIPEKGLQTALAILQEFIEKHPEADPDQIRLVRLKNIILGFQLGNEETLAWGASFIHEYENSKEAPEVALRIGDWFAASNDFENAIQSYQQVMTLPNATAELKAHACYEEAECSSKCETVRVVETTTDENGTATTKEVSLDGQTRALQMIQEILLDRTQIPEILSRAGFLKGDILTRQGKTAEALDAYMAAQEKAGETVIGYALLGRMAELYFAQGKYDDAAESLEKIKTHGAGGDAVIRARAMLLLARCRRKQNRISEAEGIYNQIRHEYETAMRNDPKAAPSPIIYVNAVKELLEIYDEKQDTAAANTIRTLYRQINQNGFLPKLP